MNSPTIRINHNNNKLILITYFMVIIIALTCKISTLFSTFLLFIYYNHIQLFKQTKPRVTCNWSTMQARIGYRPRYEPRDHDGRGHGVKGTRRRSYNELVTVIWRRTIGSTVLPAVTVDARLPEGLEHNAVDSSLPWHWRLTYLYV